MTKLPRNINKAWKETDPIEKAFVEKMINNLKDESDESISPIISKLKETGLGIGERFMVLNWLIANIKK